MKKYIKSSKTNLVWGNYGDVNFLDGGCIIAKDPDNDSGYYVILCDYVYDTPGENNYLLQDCYVDIDDSWIDVAEVEQADNVNKETEPEWFARYCIDWYGGENFGANVPPRGLDDYTGLLYTAEEVEEYMSKYNLPSNIHFG